MYVQAAFVNTGQNDRVEVILTMKLQVEPAERGQPVEFYWDEQGQLVYDPSNQQLTYRYTADAVP